MKIFCNSSPQVVELSLFLLLISRPYTIDKKKGFPYPCYEKGVPTVHFWSLLRFLWKLKISTIFFLKRQQKGTVHSWSGWLCFAFFGPLLLLTVIWLSEKNNPPHPPGRHPNKAAPAGPPPPPPRRGPHPPPPPPPRPPPRPRRGERGSGFYPRFVAKRRNFSSFHGERKVSSGRKNEFFSLPRCLAPKGRAAATAGLFIHPPGLRRTGAVVPKKKREEKRR